MTKKELKKKYRAAKQESDARLYEAGCAAAKEWCESDPVPFDELRSLYGNRGVVEMEYEIANPCFIQHELFNSEADDFWTYALGDDFDQDCFTPAFLRGFLTTCIAFYEALELAA